MGSEDLFHKRRDRANKDLKRKKADRDSYERVIIVCEGEKTEPNYLNELITSLRLNSANVKIDGSCGSSPSSVWKHAKELYQDELKKGDPYDRVYCVIDKDSHNDYLQVISHIRNARPKKTFYVITSAPCFEYWILLHFNFQTRPFAATERYSPCGCLIAELKKSIPDYEKGRNGLYSLIAAHTDFAINNSKRALEQAKRSGTDEPTTYMHELVEYLRRIKQ